MKILSVVIPVYNEQNTIKEVILSVLKAELPIDWVKEVIVVNDGSSDRTGEILKELEGKIKVIHRDQNSGKGAALKDGLKVATGDYVLIQDADFEYSPAEYTKLLKPIDDGETSVVFGSRSLGKNQVSFSRIYYYGGLLLTKVFNLLFRTSLTDLATCYKLFSRNYIERIIKVRANDFVFDVVELSYILARYDKVVEVPVSYKSRTRTEGKKMFWQHGLGCLFAIAKLFIKEKSTKIRSFLNQKPYIKTLLVFSFFCAIFSFMYFSVLSLVSSDDHFFHFKFAELMTQRGFFGSFWNFKSLYFSKMTSNQYFVYYNFLFYLVIWPLTFIKPLFLAIKLYAVIAAALAFTVFYVCIRKFDVKYPFLWTTTIFAITGYFSLWRFFLSRPYTLAPAFLCVLLYFLYKKNYIGVFAVSFIYLYWHCSTFFFPILIALVYYALERFYFDKKADWKNLFYTTSGVAAAVAFSYVISPGFLLFIKDTLFGIYWETIIGKKVILPEGGEIYPASFFDYVNSNAFVFSAFIVAISVEVYQYFDMKIHGLVDLTKETLSRIQLRTTMFFISIGFFMGIVLVSARFNDFFVFFIGIYLILSFDSIFKNINFKKQAIGRSVMVGLVIMVVYLFASNIIFINGYIGSNGAPVEQFEGIGNWLNENTKPGDIVFNPDWSWFTQLYYYSPYNNYIAGLEPRFMYVYNPRLYWMWQSISYSGYVCEVKACPDLAEIQKTLLHNDKTAVTWYKKQGDLIAEAMLNVFHSSYIVSAENFSALNIVLDHNDHFDKVYGKYKGYFIYKVTENPIPKK